jgi:endonuclease G, mitochondrial
LGFGPSGRRFLPPPASLGLPQRTGTRATDTPDTVGSYDDRDGYQPDFLGAGKRRVDLPDLARWLHTSDVAMRLDRPGECVLPYRHFSVVVAGRRRMPLFSAVNIDGRSEQPNAQYGDTWKPDPRIPRECQILFECYGGLLVHGQMTRREDPNWGPLVDAAQADADTFHATNAVPRAHGFHPLWLNVQDHLLRFSPRQEMKASIMTGPVLTDDDVVMSGIRIPTRFWKLVAIVNDETRALSVSAYLASVDADFEERRSAQQLLGHYRSWQVPVRRIAALTRLGFGHLQKFDPMDAADARHAVELNAFEDAEI